MNKVVVVTGNRADYGLLKPLLYELDSQGFDVKLIATGDHLSEKGCQSITEIDFPIEASININVNPSKKTGIGSSIGLGVRKFTKKLFELQPEIIVLLGDRYETLAVAIAAMSLNIPIAHIGGGEISEGAIDENIRHAITKLSHLHFTMTDLCGYRVKSLAEESWRIHVTGSLNQDKMNLITVGELEKELKICFDKKTILCVYHPVTLELENRSEFEIQEVLAAIKKLDYQTIIIYPNLDYGGDIIIKEIKEFAKSNKNIILLKNVPRDQFMSLMSCVDVMIGNSSAAIIDSPLFKLPVVNIGDRQNGRDQDKNVVNVKCKCNKIATATYKILQSEQMKKRLTDVINKNSDGFAARKIVKVLKETELNQELLVKKFNIWDSGFGGEE